MDLVDLDRVLDEFEATEEQSSTTAVPLVKAGIQPAFSTETKSNQQELIDLAQNGLGKKAHDLWLDTGQPNGSHPSTDDDNSRVQECGILAPGPCLFELPELSLTSAPVEASMIWTSDSRSNTPTLPSNHEAAQAILMESSAPISPAPPPDLTNNATALNIEQEPEDPKSSPLANDMLPLEILVDQQQRPPPDVVAGHRITRSGSSTPSPISLVTSKKIVSFYDNDEQEQKQVVTEEELERYLNELEMKIGESSSLDEHKSQDETQKAPSSEQLQSYLEDLEKVGGGSEFNPENTASMEESKSEEKMPLLMESNLEIPKKTPEAPASIIETSVIPTAAKEDPNSHQTSTVPNVNEERVLLDKEKTQAQLYQEAEFDDEDTDEDPYVMLAFSSFGNPSISDGNVLQQDLKTEIEQALLASQQAVPAVTKSVENTRNENEISDRQNSIVESSGESFEVCSEPTTAIARSGTAIERLKEDVTPETSDSQSDRAKQGADLVQSIGDTGLEAAQELLSSAGASGSASYQCPESDIPTDASISKRQLVTVVRLDPVSSSDQQTPSGNAQLKLTESELQLGRVQPVWIPDQDSPVCMLCESKFTLIRRRHHCRACGRVLCNLCCNQRAKLPFMTPTSPQASSGDSGKQHKQEARVCSSCFDRLKRIEDYEKQTAGTSGTNDGSQAIGCQAADQNAGQSSSATAEAIVPSPPPRPPVLKREGSSVRRGEPKQVMFSDGIKPGGDLTETPPTATTPSPSQPTLPQSTASTAPKVSTTSHHLKSSSSTKSIRAHELESFFTLPSTETTSEQPADCFKWPPIIDDKGDLTHANDDIVAKAFGEMLENKDMQKNVTFALKRNLRVLVRLTEMDCCLNRTVWCFATDGLRNVSQDEILVVIERGMEPETSQAEATPPLDMFVYFNVLYDEALKGKPLGDLNYTIFSQSGMHPADPIKGYFGSKDNAGFLHFRPTYQCLQNLCLPEQPFLVGVLIQKSEVSWAKVMPLRLLLRLGVEYRYYPYPLLSDCSRKALFYETGHTIMNLLTDMRNFTYSLAAIIGCTVSLEDDKTIISIPVDQYTQVLKILQSSNEHVLAWAASLHKSADAHLVCVQQPDTLTYTSQTINRENQGRKVTGACFVVFNASLKAGGGMSRISIVEDGLMVQIRPEAMERLRQSLHQQQSFGLIPQSPGAEKPSADANTNVEIRWVSAAEKLTRYQIKSHIDNHDLTDRRRYRLNGKPVESTNGRKLIRLIELYLLCDGDENDSSNAGEPEDLHSMVRQVAAACGTVLLPFVDILDDASMKTIAVRFAMGADLVEYSVGSNGQQLADPVMAAVDDVLIPLLHSRAMGGDGSVNDGNARIWRVELIMRLLDLS